MNFTSRVWLAYLAASASLAKGSPAHMTLATSAACGEGAERVCYGVDGGISQKIDTADLEYVAAYLRYIGQSNTGSAAFWNMAPGFDCAEWELPLFDVGGTVMALAKHISPRVNSSILYEDIANTIDGGEGASDDARKAALLGCGEHGGQLGIKADAANAAYNTAEYKESKAKPEGVIIKIVKAPVKSG